MNRTLSTVLSYCCHPLLMPSLTFLILYYTTPELVKPLSLVTLPFLFFTTFLIPIFSIFMLKLWGSVESLRMEQKEDRLLPFSFVTLFYGMTTYMFIFKIHVNEIIAVIFLSTTVLLLALTIITIWFKISIHAAGLAGLLGYLVALLVQFPSGNLFFPVIGVLLLSSLVMSARMALDVHKPSEIWLGAAVGFSACFGALFLFG